MPYLSRDILNYAMTAAILALAFLFSWILIYVIRIFKEMRKVMSDVTAAVEKFNHVLDFTKEKISGAAAIVPVLIKGGEKIVEMIRSMRERNANDRSDEKQKSRKQK